MLFFLRCVSVIRSLASSTVLTVFYERVKELCCDEMCCDVLCCAVL